MTIKGQRVGSTLGNADYGIPVLILAIPLALAFVIRRKFLYIINLILLLVMLVLALPIPNLTGDWNPGVAKEGLLEERSIALDMIANLPLVAAERVRVRLGIWEAGIKATLAHPILGTGPNTFRDVFTLYVPLSYARMLPNYCEDKVHNEFIEVAQSTGLIGLVSYLWMLGAVFWFLVKWLVSNRKEADSALMIAIFIALLLYTAYTFMLFHTIAAYTWFWILASVGAGLCQYSGTVLEKKIKPHTCVCLTTATITLIAVAGLGYMSLRPVFADANNTIARRLVAKDIQSLTEAAYWFRRAADWYPFEYQYSRSAANALSTLRIRNKSDPVTDPKFQQAIHYIDRAVRQEPHYANVYFNRALVYLRSEKSAEDVLRELDKAISLYPYYVMALSLKADILRSQENYLQAQVLQWTSLLNGNCGHYEFFGTTFVIGLMDGGGATPTARSTLPVTP